MIGRENDAAQGGPAVAESGGSVAEQHHSLEVTTSLDHDDPVRPSAADAKGADYTPKSVTRKPLGCLVEIAETLILTIVIFWLIQTFVAQPYKVQQMSMETTLLPDQYVLVDKLTPRFDSFSRGDIVVFNPVVREGACTSPVTSQPPGDLIPYIKRVIGEPGDMVTLRNGGVYVNGVMLDEPYVHGQPTEPLSDQRSWTVASDRLFVMGDNRQNSTDSRSDQIGEVCAGDVIGRAWLRYWPINTFGILQTPTYPDVPASEGGNQPQSTATP